MNLLNLQYAQPMFYLGNLSLLKVHPITFHLELTKMNRLHHFQHFTRLSHQFLYHLDLYIPQRFAHLQEEGQI
jgi:hypothetical protein